MFGNQFYPTPDSLVDKMIKPYIKEYKDDRYSWRHSSIQASKILEPSAGKGNILDRVTGEYRFDKRNIACIELDPELRMILGSKFYRIIDSDFLDHEPDEFFDLILMNPSFNAGVDHILKAWEVTEKHVCCVLNAETIRNPYTEKRRLLLELIEQFGRYEFHCEQFMDAEHDTDVEIAIVWLQKPDKGKSVEFGEDYETEYTPKIDEFNENALANRNVIQALVDQYQTAKTLLEDIHKTNSKLSFFIRDVIKETFVEKRKETVNGNLQESVEMLKISFWKYVFNKTKIGRVTTSKFQKDFEAFASSTHNMAFSVKNIMSVLEMFLLNKNAMMERCLLETFDAACAYHSDNKIHWEGWKTNDSYRCAKKIIMPYGISWDKDRYSGGWSTSWSRDDFFMDMDKVMCFLIGTKIDDIHSIASAVYDRVHKLNSNGHLDHRSPFYSSFFEIHIFKKGTIHIEFQDEDLWDKFNLAAAKGKNWLPVKEEGGFGQKSFL